MPDQSRLLTLDARMPPPRLAALTRDFGRDLTRAGFPASIATAEPVAGARGDAVTLGQIALGLVSSGAVTALFECLKAYLARERSLVVKVTRPDGGVIEVNARNVDDPAVRQALGTALSAH